MSSTHLFHVQFCLPFVRALRAIMFCTVRHPDGESGIGGSMGGSGIQDQEGSSSEPPATSASPSTSTTCTFTPQLPGEQNVKFPQSGASIRDCCENLDSEFLDKHPNRVQCAPTSLSTAALVALACSCPGKTQGLWSVCFFFSPKTSKQSQIPSCKSQNIKNIQTYPNNPKFNEL